MTLEKTNSLRRRAAQSSGVAAVALAAVLLSGCYTDPATGRIMAGRAPRGPSPQELRMRQLETTNAELQRQLRSVQSELEGVGMSVSTVSQRSEENERAANARGQDAIAMRGDLSALERRVAALESALSKVPGTISSALSAEHQAIVADVNKALAASEKRTSAAVRDAVRQSAGSRSNSGGGGRRDSGASSPPRSGEFYEWTVEPGQTLSQISAAFGVPVQTIMNDNGIKDASKIRAGQTLWIQAK